LERIGKIQNSKFKIQNSKFIKKILNSSLLREKGEKIMSIEIEELKKTASKLLAGMLANPHIYPQISDGGGYGRMEKQLVIVAVEMAESLIEYIENTHFSTEKEVSSNK
jgi:hypothetical protein